MTNSLCYSVRFLQPHGHGRGDGGEPEWPPSPLRLFQALVAAAAARWNERQRLVYAKPALEWLEAQAPPLVVAAAGLTSDVRTQFYVPDNTADLLVPQFKRGVVDATSKRTEKVVRPTHLSGDAVHYLYPLPPEGCPHLEVLKAAARSITHLGWGIDMVAGDAAVISQEEADQLPGHRWRVVQSGGSPLRVPNPGTLVDLMRKYEAFLSRLSADGFRPVPPLSCFHVVQYHAPTVPGLGDVVRPMAAFEIHRTIEDQGANAGRSRFRPFHPVRRVATVAGMVRNAVAAVADKLGHPKEWVDEHVLGHGDGKHGQATTRQRLMFLPLPSITPVGVSGIRRVLVVGWPGFDITPFRRLLNGHYLIDEATTQPAAMLAHLATSDRSVSPFTKPSRMWITVTPVILPGYDDPDGLRRKHRARALAGQVTADQQRQLLQRLDRRIDELIRKSFEHAGWTADALIGATLEYQKVGWLQGVDLAGQYSLPPLDYPKFHVRVTFPRKVRGPIAIGAGRYRGLGVFAAVDDGGAGPSHVHSR